jgi:hypothetical protein
MGTECGPQYVDIQDVHLPRTAQPTSGATTNELQPARPSRRRPGAARRPRDVFVLAADEASTDGDGVWGIAQVIADDRAGTATISNAGG